MISQSVACETSHFLKKQFLMSQIYYNGLVCNRVQIHSLGYARSKQNLLIELRLLKNISFFLNGNIKHHGALSLFDKRKPVRHVSILTFRCSYKDKTKFLTEQLMMNLRRRAIKRCSL